MAALQKTYSGDLTGSLARRLGTLIGNAADTASEQRALLEGVAAHENSDICKESGGLGPEESPFFRDFKLPFYKQLGLRVTDGSIFRQALRHKLTPNPMGWFGSRFYKKPFSPEMLTGQRRPLRPRSIIDPKPNNAAIQARLAGQPFANVAAGADLKYQRAITRGASYGVTPMIGGEGGSSSSPLQQTRKGPAVEVKDPKLGKFFRAVARSLSASISGMSEKLDSNEESLITAKEGILGTVKKLEYTSDVLETKLDAIIDALRNQNRQRIIAEDNKEAARTKAKTDLQNQQYEGEVAQKVGEDKLEFMMRDAADEREDDPQTDMGGDGESPNPWDDAPRLSRGGIVEGSMGGYPAILHGREAVVPLKTPFTQQHYSAGTISGKPSALSSLKAKDETVPTTFEKFVPNMFNQIIESKVAEIPKMKETTEMLGKLVEFPVKASGLITFNVLAKALSGMRTLAADVSGPLSTILSGLGPFGIANSVINSLTRNLSVGGAAVGRQQANKAYGQDLRHGNMMSKFMTNVNNLIAGSGEDGKDGKGGGGYRGGGGMYAGGGPGNVIEGAKTWWNRGRNVRIPNENAASIKDLFIDDAKQMTHSNRAFKTGNTSWRSLRPLKAFLDPELRGTGPTPAIRQAVERPLRALQSIGAIRGGAWGLILADIMKGHGLSEEEWMSGPGTLDHHTKYMQSINRTDTSDRLSNFVNLQSFENQSSKIGSFEAQKSKIIEINNKGVTSTDQPDDRLEHIANNPNSIMDVYYPSPYN